MRGIFQQLLTNLPLFRLTGTLLTVVKIDTITVENSDDVNDSCRERDNSNEI